MHLSSWLGMNRILNLLLLSALVGGAGSAEGIFCCFFYCVEEPSPGDEISGSEGGGFGQIGATIIDLTFKGLPIVADPDDADPKDTALSKSKQNSPSFGTVTRMVMRAKKDGAAHRMLYQREFQETFQSGISISVNPDVGTLVDGQSAGYFEVRQTASTGPEGLPIFLRMTATWDAKSQGLSISAEDQGGPLGDPVAFPGSTEVDMAISWNAKGRFLSAFPTGEFEEGFGFFDFTDVVPVPSGVPFFLAFGVESLGKAAQFLFVNLSIRSDGLHSGGDEIKAAMYATIALSFIEKAWVFAQEGFDTSLVKSNLTVGLLYLEAAKDSLEESMASGTIHESAQTKLAVRSLKKGMQRLTKGGKLADKLLKKEKEPTNSLANRCNQARWEALLIQAQLFGFKSKSIDKYFKTLVVDQSAIF